MAKIFVFRPGVDVDGKKRDDEPLPRPFVKLKDGTTLSYKAWYRTGRPS
jgi:hypothetical protein